MGGGFPWWAPEHYEQNRVLVQSLTDIAATKEATVSQLALAWLLAQGEQIVPIPGSRNPQRVVENCAAAGLVLTPEALDQINAIMHEDPAGARASHVPTWH